MTHIEDDGREGQGAEEQELAEGGGIGIGAGEPSTFEPEEDPETVPDEDTNA